MGPPLGGAWVVCRFGLFLIDKSAFPQVAQFAKADGALGRQRGGEMGAAQPASLSNALAGAAAVVFFAGAQGDARQLRPEVRPFFLEALQATLRLLELVQWTIRGI